MPALRLGPLTVENLRVSFFRGNLGEKEEIMSKRLRALQREIERRGGMACLAFTGSLPQLAPDRNRWSDLHHTNAAKLPARASKP